MTYLIIVALAALAAAGFGASYLPGLGIGPLWTARLRLAEACGFGQNVIALLEVVRVIALMTIAGVLRLITFVTGAAMILTEALYERPTPNAIDENEQDSETRGEITDGS